MSKFKVGDKVVGNKSANVRYCITKEGYTGIVTRVFSSGNIMLNNSYLVNEQCFDLASPANHSIHITCTDGKTTHAVKKIDGKIVARAKAECCPTDEFNFNVGAQLAFNRLVYGTDYHPAEVAITTEQPKQEPVKLYCVEGYLPGIWLTKGKAYEVDTTGMVKMDDGYAAEYDSVPLDGKPFAEYFVPLVSRPAKVGEWVYIKKKIGDYAYNVGDIGKVEKTYPQSGDIRAFGGLYVLATEYLVLDGYKPEPEKAEPEYYNGKVVCVDSARHYHTVGKTYTVTDGFLIDDSGTKVPYLTGPVTSVDDLNSRSACKFAVLLDE